LAGLENKARELKIGLSENIVPWECKKLKKEPTVKKTINSSVLCF